MKPRSEFFEETIQTKNVYDGRVLHVKELTVKLPNGKPATREVIYHNGACAILPVKEDKFIFVRQFRKALEEDMLEVPAGKIEGTEDPELCAKRELQEETGYAANKMSFLLDFYTAAGYSSEKLSIFLAQDLTYTAPSPDEDEFVAVEEIPQQKALEMVMQGEIKDCKTIIAILAYFQNKG